MFISKGRNIYSFLIFIFNAILMFYSSPTNFGEEPREMTSFSVKLDYFKLHELLQDDRDYFF